MANRTDENLADSIVLSDKHAVANTAARRGVSIYTWYVVVLLTVASTLSYVDRQILALVIGPVRRDLGISDMEVSLLIGGAFASFYTIMTLPMAWLADRYSRKWLIAAGVFVWSLMTALSGLASKYSHLFLARMGVGVGEATLSPAAYSMLADYFDKLRLPLAVGLFQSATFLGTGIAYVIGGPLVDYLESLDERTLPIIGPVGSWHAVFLIVGLPGVLVAVLIALTMREPERTGRMNDGPSRQGVPMRVVLRFVRARAIFFLCVCGGFFLMATQGFALFAWTAEYLVRVHAMSRTTAGLSFGIIAVVVGIGGSLCGGFFATWLVARGYSDGLMRLAVIKCALSAPFAIAYGLAPNPELAVGLLVPLTFLMALTPGLGAAVVQAVAPNEMRGQMVALYGVTTTFLSYLLAPIMIAAMTQYVYQDDAALGASMATVGGIAYPVAALLLIAGLPHYRRLLKRASEWDGSKAPGDTTTAVG